MNRISKWFSILVTVTALGGAAITAQAIEPDVDVQGDADAYSYLSTEMLGFDGQTLNTEAGSFLVDSSVKVTDHRIPDESGRLPDDARVQLAMEDGVLREVVIY